MTDETVTVVAHVKARPGAEREVEEGLRALVAQSRAEKGCLSYDLHRSEDDPCLFLLYENWESEEALQDHLLTTHVQDALKEVAPLLTERADITRWKRIV